MSHKSLLARIDEELRFATDSLRFWSEQVMLLSTSEFQLTAKRQVMHREAEIHRLREAQEVLLGEIAS